MGVISATPLLAGLNTQSRPNALAFDVVASLQGQHEVSSETLRNHHQRKHLTNKKSQLRTDYDDSTTSNFNFKSFYFGCVLPTQETLASLPLSCSVQVTGYRNGKQVASQKADFRKPLLQLTANMAKVELNDGFCDVDRVSFDTTGGLIPEVLTAVLMDEFEYTTFSKQY